VGIVVTSSSTYVCDQCAKEVTPTATGGPMGVPSGWRQVSPADAVGDLFCSWTCLAAFAAEQAEVPR